jgi:hypothetical protein
MMYGTGWPGRCRIDSCAAAAASAYRPGLEVGVGVVELVFVAEDVEEAQPNAAIEREHREQGGQARAAERAGARFGA